MFWRYWTPNKTPDLHFYQKCIIKQDTLLCISLRMYNAWTQYLYICTGLKPLFAPLVVFLMKLLGEIYVRDNNGVKCTRSIFGWVPRVPTGMVFVPVWEQVSGKVVWDDYSTRNDSLCHRITLCALAPRGRGNGDFLLACGNSWVSAYLSFMLDEIWGLYNTSAEGQRSSLQFRNSTAHGEGRGKTTLQNSSRGHLYRSSIPQHQK